MKVNGCAIKCDANLSGANLLADNEPKTDEEDDIPEKIPEVKPVRIPQPVRPGTPAPSRPQPVRPEPVRPGVPAGGIAPRMPKTDEPMEIPEKIPEVKPVRIPQPVRPGTPAPSRPQPVRPERIPPPDSPSPSPVPRGPKPPRLPPGRVTPELNARFDCSPRDK